MNYKLYNYLRLMGLPAEAATVIANNSQATVDIYEHKPQIDNASRGGFSHVIGLKEEYKQALPVLH